MKVLISQINPCVGDLVGNLSLIQQSILQAISSDCDVVLFPELATTGYPPRDLLYSSAFWANHKIVIDKLEAFVRQQSRQITVIVGGLHEEMLTGGRYARYNAAWILDKHFGRRVIHKRLLPCYDVFDETRYFSSGIDEPYAPIPICLQNGSVVSCDVLICEDIWNNEHCGGEEWMKPATYITDPIDQLVLVRETHVEGAIFGSVPNRARGPLFVLNGSPFWLGKIEETQKLIEAVCARIQRPVVWCNQVGSHDDIITGGYSMVSIPGNLNRSGITSRAKAFQEDQMVVQIPGILLPTLPPSIVNLNGPQTVDEADFEMWTIYKALFLHMSDYKRRCGFKRAVLGLSGGIDSAVVAVIAAHVFGSENVTGIGMPSPYSSEGSVDDAAILADNLKIRFEVKRITDIYEKVKALFLSGGKQKFDNPLTDENIQPRARAMILMAYSNEYDPCLLLTTGNKSEITVGYCTINGDMCGGLAVISDLWKTQVYALADFLNKYFGNPIPEDTITKPASAELRPDQQDTDSLPPYEILDPLLQMFVEQEMSPVEVMQTDWFRTTDIPGAYPDMIKRGQTTSRMIKDMYHKYRTSEYKRQQMACGPKLSRRAFTSGRRMPVACKITYCT